MRTIELPPNTAHVRFDELPHLIAHAVHPIVDHSSELEQFSYGGARINLEAELKQAVRDGKLPVKDPLTLGPHSLPFGAALESSLVRVADLRAFIADRGISVIVEEQILPPSTAKLTHGTDKRWTPERLAELNDYRAKHTMPETAAKFSISEQRIRKLLPTKKAKPKASPFSGL